jgi:hypothetical protein
MAESNTVRLARLEEKFDSMAKDINQIKKVLEGNGNPGFIGRLEEVEKKLSEYNGGTKMIGAILGSSLVTGVLVFVLGKVF